MAAEKQLNILIIDDNELARAMQRLNACSRPAESTVTVRAGAIRDASTLQG